MPAYCRSAYVWRFAIAEKNEKKTQNTIMVQKIKKQQQKNREK
jgi:hypothetical protein